MSDRHDDQQQQQKKFSPRRTGHVHTQGIQENGKSNIQHESWREFSLHKNKGDSSSPAYSAAAAAESPPPPINSPPLCRQPGSDTKREPRRGQGTAGGEKKHSKRLLGGVTADATHADRMAASSSASTSSTSGAGSVSTPRPPRQQQQRGTGSAATTSSSSSSSPVFLNVYDVTPANGYARWLGLGVYHSGVQVHGVEYAYGAHEGAGSGIFEVPPRRCPGYAFREAVAVGTTELTRAQVRALMAELADDFPGDAYNLVSRNCNHFCDAACRRLVSARIPRWVNRLAKIGVVFTCVIPAGKQVRRKVEPAGIRSRSARQAADANANAAAPPRHKTFFRSLSVGGTKNVTTTTTRRPLPTPTPPPAPTLTSTSSAST